MTLDKRSRVILEQGINNKRSRLIKTSEDISSLQNYEIIPDGMFGLKAVIKSGSVTISYDELDFDYTIPFDDDVEPNETEIVIYNLSDNTINNLKKSAEISIEAGYKDDIGVIYKGYIKSISTGWEDVDKLTTLICTTCNKDDTVINVSYSANTKASYILKNLIGKLGMPIAVFSVRRDWTYTDGVTVDGNLREEIKKYAEVCGISVYANNGSIYARYIKDGDNINFTVNEDTGLIGSPEHYTEEINAEDYVDEIDGYKIEMLLQHRITTAAIINLSSRSVSGTFRVRKGEHRFSDGQATTYFEAIGSITSHTKEKKNKSKSNSKSGNKIVDYAKKLIGTPYVYGGATVKGFDCSGFVSYVMLHCGVKTKVKQRANSTALYNMSKKVSTPDVGDIAYFDNGADKHIGICVGNGKMINAYGPEGKGKVGITTISSGGKLVGYGRLID